MGRYRRHFRLAVLRCSALGAAVSADLPTRLEGAAAGSREPIDFEEVASGVLDAIRPVVEREMREASNQLYGATMEAVQDYLSDNVNFNIRSRLESAERGRRAEWERAEGLVKSKADLLKALQEIKDLGSDGEHSGDRHARCRGIAHAAIIRAHAEQVPS